MPEHGGASTGVYVYGVLHVGEPVEDLPPGLDGAAVDLLTHGEVAAAISDIALERPPGRRAEIMAHSAVLDALSRFGPVVPVQFGSIMVDADDVVEHLLAPEHDRFVSLIDRLRGNHQYDVQVRYRENQGLSEVLRSNPDITALRQRTLGLPDGVVHPDLVRLGELVAQAMERKRGDDAEDVWQVIAPHVLLSAPRPVGGLDDVMEVAILVPDENVHDLEHALELQAEAAHERMRISLRGPTAPYDFVEEAVWA
jgi:hypothetical protein